MTALARTVLLSCVCVFLLGNAKNARGDKPDPFTPIFDGKTLKGWEGDKTVFRVVDGAIVGGSLKKGLPDNLFLASEHEYKDFVLSLQCKLVGKRANGGIQFRSQRVPNSGEMKGYQADMDENWWGNLYEESRRNKILAGPNAEQRKKIVHPNDWNDYVIRCEGDHIQLWLNGFKTVDFTETDKGALKTGVLGLQIHADKYPSEAWYRNIKILVLPGK